MPFHTLELRWFFEGDLPSSVREWLESLGVDAPLVAEERVDDYVALPSVRDLGIKIREGRFELKGRTYLLGDWSLGRGPAGPVVGQAEMWVKWSYAGVAVDRVAGVVDTGAIDVVSVAKRRVQRRFDLTQVEQPLAVGLDEWPARGASFELAEVEARGRRDWSLGVEAYPGDVSLVESLRRLAGDELRAVPDAHLDRAHARSYPAWLAEWVLKR